MCCNHNDCAVSGGHVSLIQGSYEYYHYLHDGFDDSVTHLSLASSGFFAKIFLFEWGSKLFVNNI